jgi:sugar-specific transcriptional regulator TrmB
VKSDEKLIALLASVGINRNEALTYGALLQLETVSIRKVAAATGINRGTTYEALKRLVTLGLVGMQKRGKREYFTAESPERINDLIRELRRDLLEASQSAKTLIPALMAGSPRDPERPVVRYYEDDEGVAAILRDVLQTCRMLDKRLYHVYSSDRVRQYLYRNFPQFTERRIAEQIAVQVIAEGSASGGEPAPMSERRHSHARSEAELSSYTLIYGNKVAVISITNDLVPYGVVVEDPNVASMQRLFFTQLWEYL